MMFFVGLSLAADLGTCIERVPDGELGQYISEPLPFELTVEPYQPLPVLEGLPPVRVVRAGEPIPVFSGDEVLLAVDPALPGAELLTLLQALAETETHARFLYRPRSPRREDAMCADAWGNWPIPPGGADPQTDPVTGWTTALEACRATAAFEEGCPTEADWRAVLASGRCNLVSPLLRVAVAAEQPATPSASLLFEAERLPEVAPEKSFGELGISTIDDWARPRTATQQPLHTIAGVRIRRDGVRRSTKPTHPWGAKPRAPARCAFTVLVGDRGRMLAAQRARTSQNCDAPFVEASLDALRKYRFEKPSRVDDGLYLTSETFVFR
jgi:hypothetical protein